MPALEPYFFLTIPEYFICKYVDLPYPIWYSRVQKNFRKVWDQDQCKKELALHAAAWI